MRAATVALLIVGASPLQQLFYIPPGLSVSIWLPSGIGAAAVLLWGRQVWPGIALGSFVLCLLGLEPSEDLSGTLQNFVVSAMIAGFMTLEPLLIGGLYQRCRVEDPFLSRVRNVAALLLLAGPVGCTSGAIGSALTLATTGHLEWPQVPAILASWLLSGLTGIHLITPAALVFSARTPYPLARRDRIAAVVSLGCLALVCVITFFDALPIESRAFLPIPVIVLVAYRFDDRLASLVGPGVALVAVVAAAGGYGPFGEALTRQSLVALQLFLIVSVLTSLIARALNNEREAAEQQARRLGTELSHVSRVTMMGEIAAGMAHEYHQPLTAICNYASAGLMKLDRNGESARLELRPLLERVVDEAMHAAETVDRLKAFMQKREPERSLCDLESLVADALHLTQMGYFFPGIALSYECAPDLPPICIDPVQIKQILVNLVVNACEAIESNSVADGVVHVVVRKDGGDRVSILVEDNGPGMDAATTRHCFDPFFTTKERGLGVGLGISRALAAAHGGRLYLCEGSGRGARFCLELPVLAASAEAFASPRATA